MSILTLSKRELQVRNGLLEGMALKEIAYDLGISLSRVSDCWEVIKAHDGVETISQLLVKVLTQP